MANDFSSLEDCNVPMNNNLVPSFVEEYLSSVEELKKDVLSHLLYLGWTIKNKKQYVTPDHKTTFTSLKDVCNYLNKDGDWGGAQPVDIVPKSDSISVNPPQHLTLLEQARNINQRKKRDRQTEEDWTVYCLPKKRRKEKSSSHGTAEKEQQIISSSLSREPSTTAGGGSSNAENSRKRRSPTCEPLHISLKQFGDEVNHVPKKPRKEKNTSSFQAGVETSTAGGTSVNQLKNPPTPPNQIASIRDRPLTMLSWLVDMKAIEEGVTVTTRSGKVKNRGINCSCCNNWFSQSDFDAHSRNLQLSNGKSLLQCQKQALKNANKNRKFSNLFRDATVCSCCIGSGFMLHCDYCLNAYHHPCVGLVEKPSGETWSCPSCRCAKCSNENPLTSDQAVRCEQCHRNFHLKCLNDNEKPESGSPWFCCDQCAIISAGLEDIVGKPNPIGDDLTWWLLQPDRDNKQVENNCKLWQAVNVFDECFEGLYDPNYGSDFARDIVFNRRSKLKRKNYEGFYTIILEKDDEVLSVALIRIFGAKVAEMPLFCTRFKHRRQGWARVLFNELEKMLLKLGVEMLVLPTDHQKPSLNMWVSSFNFVESTIEDKLQLLPYTLINFPDSIKCHKLFSTHINTKA